MRFDEIVPDVSSVMGVKAVFGVLVSRVMCFGSRGDLAKSPGRHYQAAKSTAEKAMTQRWLISIGGGADAPKELRGHVLNLTSVSSIYGETDAFVDDPTERARLRQWPTAVALRDVYDVVGYPHIVDDLGFPDLMILENAFDQVIRPTLKVEQLFEAVRQWEVTLRDLPPILRFHDEDKVAQVGTYLPYKLSAEEGKKYLQLSQFAERDAGLSKAAKAENACRNGGRISCSGCDFSDENQSLFDVHHLEPISLKVRHTVLSDLAVLCPTCHRVCHRLAKNAAQPMPVAELRNWWKVRKSSATVTHPTAE